MRLQLIAIILVGLGLSGPAQAQEPGALMDNGLHYQEWIKVSTGDLRSELLNAAAQDKNLMLLIEQRGCQYCEQLHKENFAHPEIVDVLQQSFVVLQLDMVGNREFVDFDGAVLSEAKLMRKWGVATTPTTIVLRSGLPIATSIAQAEEFRLPGYLGSFQYFAVLDYFASGAFEEQELRTFMQVKAAEFSQRGIDPQRW